ncbi:L-aspartate oxidase [Sulfurospirillum arcachonense]|uniref:L-aspartate oxidase n=1 Tax=Sulfurospirillum arcachonense TaxID=57666 RepID=UPI000469192B|nr:L-aspartate oxidase [Sulfurospirillum arcachonense]
MKTTYDVLIIGSGVAGLNTALCLPDDMEVLVLSKDYAWECNTFYAQGGIAVAPNEEDIPLHVKDTLDAGAGHCDMKAVELLCSEGPKAIESLCKSGFQFDSDENGNLLYTKEAAHSTDRILHAGGDSTGRELHLFLMQSLKFPILYNTQVIDLLIKDKICYGVQVFHANKIFNLYAKKIVIASGGVGSLYEYHTNSRTISADMHGICCEHGIELQDMEMMQFHPTVFVEGNAVRKQLLSEALRGEGAKIVDEDGNRFLFSYDKRGELSPRNIVSEALFDHHQKTNKKIYLDLSSFEKKHFKKRFPSIYFNMKNLGFNIPDEKIPISPAFHYAMGGIKTDFDGKINNLQDVYAVGEIASVGVHGANRLASNSLLEGLVFSRRVVSDICKTFTCKEKNIDFPNTAVSLINDGDKDLKNELRNLMWQNAGIVRTQNNLQKALNRVEEMLKLQTGKLIRLRLLTSRVIIKSALRRKKSLGAHYIKG